MSAGYLSDQELDAIETVIREGRDKESAQHRLVLTAPPSLVMDLIWTIRAERELLRQCRKVIVSLSQRRYEHEVE